MAVRDPDVEPGAHLAAHPEILYDPIYELGRRRSRTTFARSLSRRPRGPRRRSSSIHAFLSPFLGADAIASIASFREIFRALIRELPWKYADRPIYPGANISRAELSRNPRGFGRLEESSGRAPWRFRRESPATSESRLSSRIWDTRNLRKIIGGSLEIEKHSLCSPLDDLIILSGDRTETYHAERNARLPPSA